MGGLGPPTPFDLLKENSMSIVAIHGPSTWGDSSDQANDPIGMAGYGDSVATAYDAMTTSTGTAANAVTASASSEALQPTRVTGY